MFDGKTAAGLPTRAPEETPSRMEALRLYREGARSFPDNAQRGSFAVGKLADLAVRTEGFTIPVDRIGTIRSVLTVVGGRVVHASEPYAAPKRNDELKNVHQVSHRRAPR